MTRSEFASAIPGFYDRLLEDLTRMCGSLDKAQDVVQEALASAWQNVGQYRGESDVFFWVERIALNVYKYTSRKWSLDSGPLDDAACLVPDVPEADKVFEYESLYKAMDRLNGGERTLVHLRYYLDKSYEEMSAITGRNVGSVRSGLYHIKKTEQKEKEGWGTDPVPEGMFIQFYPGKGDATPTYRGISVNFPDGTNLSLQECSAEGLSSLIDIYKRRKEAASCSL